MASGDVMVQFMTLDAKQCNYTVVAEALYRCGHRPPAVCLWFGEHGGHLTHFFVSFSTQFFFYNLLWKLLCEENDWDALLNTSAARVNRETRRLGEGVNSRDKSSRWQGEVTELSSSCVTCRCEFWQIKKWRFKMYRKENKNLISASVHCKKPS